MMTIALTAQHRGREGKGLIVLMINIKMLMIKMMPIKIKMMMIKIKMMMMRIIYG